MVTSDNLVYSRSAAARLMGVAVNQVGRIQQFAFVVWVWIRGKRPRFISKRSFLQHFAQWRQRQANTLKAKRWPQLPSWWTVTNPNKQSRYPVVLGEKGPVCRCEDYKNQQQFLGRGVCKHGYAVLSALGFKSLAAYKKNIGRD